MNGSRFAFFFFFFLLNRLLTSSLNTTHISALCVCVCNVSRLAALPYRVEWRSKDWRKSSSTSGATTSRSCSSSSACRLPTSLLLSSPPRFAFLAPLATLLGLVGRVRPDPGVNGFCADARTYHVQTVDFALVAMFKYTCGLEFYPDFGYDSVTTAGHGTLDLCCLSNHASCCSSR